NVGTTSGDWYSGQLDENGVPFSTMRDGTPKGYAFINFSGNQYSIDYKVAGHSEDYQMEIFAPKVVEKDKRTSANIYVNFFMGSKQDTVMYRIDEGEWQKMWYHETYDPSYWHKVHEWDVTTKLLPGRRPSNPVSSTHLWRGRIPTNLSVGEHTIEVKATDRFGRAFVQRKSYRIEVREYCHVKAPLYCCWNGRQKVAG